MARLIVIGLDGTTFRVLKPLLQEGRLPHLERAISGGAHGVLETTFPPLTAPAWTSLATGKNPGKTGVFDFFNRVSPNSYRTKVLTSSEIKRARPYWDYLSEAGVKVGVVNYPLLYPPYSINGIMVSGLGSSPEDDICRPAEFKQALLECCPDYRIHIPWNEPQYAGDPSLFVRDILALLKVNHRTLELLFRQDLEVITFVISATDFAQHYMWRYIDATHPHYQAAEAEKYGEAFAGIWERVDEIVGSALEAAGGGAHLLVVSDHGFGPRRSSFYTNTWLEREGYLRRRRALIQLGRVQSAVARVVRRVWPRLYHKVEEAVNLGKLSMLPVKAEVDYRRSLAFAPVDGSMGGIYLNSHAAQLRQEIVEKLAEACRSQGLAVRFHLPQETYRGPHVNIAPDILFEIDDFECEADARLGEETFQSPPPDAHYGGIHKRDGIFIACGPDIQPGVEVAGATICDVAPTLLHLMGHPVPDDMDGRVLKEVFRHDSPTAHRPVTSLSSDLTRLRERARKLRAELDTPRP